MKDTHARKAQRQCCSNRAQCYVTAKPEDSHLGPINQVRWAADASVRSSSPSPPFFFPVFACSRSRQRVSGIRVSLEGREHQGVGRGHLAMRADHPQRPLGLSGLLRYVFEEPEVHPLGRTGLDCTLMGHELRTAGMKKRSVAFVCTAV